MKSFSDKKNSIESLKHFCTVMSKKNEIKLKKY